MAEVKLFANLRQFTDKTAVTSPGTTVADVLHALFNQYPALAAAVLENNQPKPHVRIMVNGHVAALDRPEHLRHKMKKETMHEVFYQLARAAQRRD